MKFGDLLLGLAVLPALAHRATNPGAALPGVENKVPQVSALGATLPWTTYEAEQAITNGTLLGPDYTGHTPAREASGRRCVALTATGQFAEFAAKAEAQGLVVRYCIPDTPDGRGLDATLSLYINGQPHGKLPMSSRLTYLYGQYPYSNDPAAGTPRHFWDELRLMPGTIRPGDVIRLQKDANDSAANYLIDFVDLEVVPAPLQQPDDSLSIANFGATPGESSDARPALLAAITAAKAQHKSVWIPVGQFAVQGAVRLSGVAVRGAGMWYSTLVGVGDYAPRSRVLIEASGSDVTLSDFAILGKLSYRKDSEPNDGLGGTFGTGSTIRNLWVEHTKTGAWLTNSDGLLVEGCRFRDTIADGVNLCVGMRNTIVRNCSARGNGDDCFAIWPATYQRSTGEPGHNRFIHCTAQLPFLAQGFAIYGGDSNSVEDCLAIDIPYGAGLYASTTFPTELGFRGITAFRHIRLTRTGDEDGAIGTVANLRDLAGLRFEDIQVIDPPYDGIKFTSIKQHVLSDTSFEHVQIVNAGLSGRGSGIMANPSAVGSATVQDVTIVDPKSSARQIESPTFHLIQIPDHVGGQENLPSSAANETIRHRSGNS